MDEKGCQAAFVKVFDFLEIYYDLYKIDDLGGLLGSMNPYPNKGVPIDDVLMLDWLYILNCHEKDKKISSDLAFDSMILFLEKQIKNFGLQGIDILISQFKNDIFHKQKWENKWLES